MAALEGCRPPRTDPNVTKKSRIEADTGIRGRGEDTRTMRLMGASRVFKP